MVYAKPVQASFLYNWCTHCYITISQFWKHRGQVHRLCLLYCHMLPLPSTSCHISTRVHIC